MRAGGIALRANYDSHTRRLRICGGQLEYLLSASDSATGVSALGGAFSRASGSQDGWQGGNHRQLKRSPLVDRAK